MATTNTALEWHRVADVNELPVGRVKTVTAGTHSFALTNIDGQFTAMDNRCPHQGGPLGEGSIEVGNDGQCWLRCPWHGWDFDPTTGRSPGGHEDSGQQLYPVELREDGVYVGVEAELAHETTVTDKAKGQISDDHPLAAGVLGRSGTPVASWVMNECDLILAFGSSFSNHTGITPKRPIIQVDFDRMMLGKFHGVTIPMWSEIGVAARRMTAEISSAMATVDQRAELAKRWSIWREEKRSRLEDDRGHGLNSPTVFAALSGAIPGDAVIAVDVGNNTYSFGRYFESRGQRILMSGYLGSIGFSFSAAMGAWAATEDQEAYRGRKVVSVSGDRARRSGARQAVPVGRTRRQLHVQLLLSPGSRFDAVGSGLGSGWGLHRGRHEWLDLDRRPGHGSGRRVDVLGQISLVSGLVPGRPLDHLHRR